MVLRGAQQRLVDLEQGRVYAEKSLKIKFAVRKHGNAPGSTTFSGDCCVQFVQLLLTRTGPTGLCSFCRPRYRFDNDPPQTPSRFRSPSPFLVSPGTNPRSSRVPMVEDPDELAVLEEIQHELVLQEQSVIEEYERSLQFDEECLNAMLDGLEASDKIICPVCRKNNLTVKNHLVLCQCGLYITTQDMTEEKLRSLLENTITEHSYRCFHNPEFTVTSGMEEETSLLMSCSVCDSWTVLL
ncbi:PREDICTED: RPA-interacting protein [Tinamus guttatus]|nr:PREDICTED: RPA-interacting protein [Tinamus guttatus]